jgi:hypothetical protein
MSGFDAIHKPHHKPRHLAFIRHTVSPGQLLHGIRILAGAITPRQFDPARNHGHLLRTFNSKAAFFSHDPFNLSNLRKILPDIATTNSNKKGPETITSLSPGLKSCL